MVTMREIDALREEANYWLEKYRDALRPHEAKVRLDEARGMVERYLREWWAQGCVEVEAKALAEALPKLAPGYSRELCYTVQEDDTLSIIAARTGVSARSSPSASMATAHGGAYLLAWLNHTKDPDHPDHIKPGWRLILPTQADHARYESEWLSVAPLEFPAHVIRQGGKSIYLDVPEGYRGTLKLAWACGDCWDYAGTVEPPAGTRCGCGNEVFMRVLTPANPAHAVPNTRSAR
jgi:LysM repeat protein